MVRYLENRCELEPIASSVGYMEIPLSTLAQEKAPVPSYSSFSMNRLSEYPQVLALEFRDSLTMASTLGRIAYYVEDLGKTRIPKPKEYCEAGGIDLKLADVADFFNDCAKEQVNLNLEEQALKAKLIAEQLLTPVENGLLTYLQPRYQATLPYALIAVDPELEPYDRRLNFIHEYSHALYFLDEGFRSLVSKEFSSLDAGTKRFLRGVMIASGFYESGADWLMETETQAHAIEPQEEAGRDGFYNLLGWAGEMCRNYPERNPDSCKDVYSYSYPAKKKLINRLHERYVKITEDRIPLLLETLSLKRPPRTSPSQSKSASARS